MTFKDLKIGDGFNFIIHRAKREVTHNAIKVGSERAFWLDGDQHCFTMRDDMEVVATGRVAIHAVGVTRIY